MEKILEYNILEYNEERDYISIINSTKSEAWISFYTDKKEQYQNALKSSLTYVIYENDCYAGYIRAITDNFFTLFVCEIIIDQKYRRKGYGRLLLDYLHNLYPSTRTDLLSDNDSFYIASGFHALGNGMRNSY